MGQSMCANLLRSPSKSQGSVSTCGQRPGLEMPSTEEKVVNTLSQVLAAAELLRALLLLSWNPTTMQGKPRPHREHIAVPASSPG
jgi:hypothetical protein